MAEGLREACEASIKRLQGCAARVSAAAANADEVRAVNAEATRLQKDAEAALRKLEAEAKGSAPSARRPVLDAIATLKAALAKARADLQRANDGAGRSELLSKSGKQAQREADATGRIAAAADKAASGSAKLAQANQVLAETADIGVGVIDTMTQQRESLLRSRDKVSNVNSLSDRARGLMRMMQARAITNKALLMFVVVVLLGLIGECFSGRAGRARPPATGRPPTADTRARSSRHAAASLTVLKGPAPFPRIISRRRRRLLWFLRTKRAQCKEMRLRTKLGIFAKWFTARRTAPAGGVRAPFCPPFTALASPWPPSRAPWPAAPTRRARPPGHRPRAT